LSTIIYSLCRGVIYKNVGISLGGLSNCEELVGAYEESSEELLAQESIKPKANAKIVGKKRNFSFVIEPQNTLCT